MRSALPLVMLLGVLQVHVAAQEAADDKKVYKRGVENVQITINVAGKAGAPPKPLTQADFQLTENGVRQTITTFMVSQLSPTTRYVVGYTSTRPSVRRKIEVRVKGFKKPITKSIPPDGNDGIVFSFGK